MNTVITSNVRGFPQIFNYESDIKVPIGGVLTIYNLCTDTCTVKTKLVPWSGEGWGYTEGAAI